MSPNQYLPAFRRYWYIVLVLTLLGTMGGWGLSKAATPTYTATASLYFSLNFGGSANDLNQGSTYTQNQMLSFAQLADSALVLNPVIHDLGLNTTPAALSKSITASTQQNTVILDLSATNADPAAARRVANTLAAQLKEKVEQIAPKGANGASTVSARVIQPAVTPKVPSAPNTRLNVLAGLLLGLILGSLLVVVRELLDTRVRNSDALEAAAALPLLGSLEREKSTDGGPVMLREPLSPMSESYRQLRSNLDFVNLDSERMGLAVTSSIPGEGKSLIAANLALALGEGDRRVLLVDADLRRPMISTYTGLSDAAGLTSVLAGWAEIDEVTQPWGDSGIHVLTSGPIPPNPSQLLSSRRMSELVEQLGNEYDIVLYDTAPLVAVADAAILARMLDGALIVADRTKVHTAQLTQAIDALEKSGVTILGTVLNRVAPPKRRYRYYQRPAARNRRVSRRRGRRDSEHDPVSAPSEAQTGDQPRQNVYRIPESVTIDAEEPVSDEGLTRSSRRN